MKVKIYTRTGDLGDTSLFGGKRVPKNNIRINAYGSVDELNSLLGVVISKSQDQRVLEYINDIQKDLFLISGCLSGAKLPINGLASRVEEFENIIDELEKSLPEIHNFILPQGSECSALLFYARAVARRAERNIVALSEKEQLDNKIIIYMNRLSDLLYVVGRYVNHKSGLKETIWKST
jgi:cob(I)alamin adenosyltransferase